MVVLTLKKEKDWKRNCKNSYGRKSKDINLQIRASNTSLLPWNIFMTADLNIKLYHQFYESFDQWIRNGKTSELGATYLKARQHPSLGARIVKCLFIDFFDSKYLEFFKEFPCQAIELVLQDVPIKL